MPQKKNSGPPKAMTRRGAIPILIVAGIFDLIRIFFEMFWFFGPALAGLYCTVKVSGVLGSLGGIVAGACTAGAATAGGLAFGAIEMFGIVMADAVALAGFLVLGLLVVMTNARIFKVNKSAMLWLTGSLGVSVIPIIGTFPSFFVVLRMLYKRQIKIEAAALKKWEKENADARLQERNRQIVAQTQFAQNQYAQQSQVAQQEAMNDAIYDQIEAANDEKYNAEEIPERVRGRA